MRFEIRLGTSDDEGPGQRQASLASEIDRAQIAGLWQLGYSLNSTVIKKTANDK